jgi:hydroxyethylthiazole kinase-like uncharacterized protein yjeF
MATLPEGTLMERAATGLAVAVADFLGGVYARRVLLLIGSGDNGGDALYAGAQLARRGAAVSALLLSPDRAHAQGLAALRAAGGRVLPDLADLAGPVDLVVDGIVGIGSSGPLRPDAAAVVAALEGIPVVAVDIPSGVGVDSAELEGPHVRATLTVTFGTHKPAHLVDPAAAACGVVHLVDIGLDLPDAPLAALQAVDVAALLPVPPAAAHKYLRGVVGVRAGSEEYPGAALLVTGAAGCGFTGMVRYLGKALGPVTSARPEVVGASGRVQAWVVGPGLGAAAPEALSECLAESVPVVVDADALAALRPGHGGSMVLTPHAGELAEMLGVARAEVEARQLHFARTSAATYGAVVLLKGRHTLIAEPNGRVRATTLDAPWLATAGAGDVLAGLIGALLAAGLEPFDAASVGAWLHAAAAVRASGGGPIRASDVANAIPDVTRELLVLSGSSR